MSNDFNSHLKGIFGNDSRLLPLVVGMTGHRDIFDGETVKERVKEFFHTVWEQWKTLHKSALNVPPIAVLCGMAEGADQLVAEAVLELKTEMKINLVAVLPMPQHLFVKDFGTC
jgi:hypothetical protein